MNNNSHETTILAVVLLIVLAVVAWNLYPGLVNVWEKATKFDQAGQSARL